MFETLIDFFKPKKPTKTFLGETTTVITEERIELAHDDQTYSFFIGSSSDGQWFAITDETQSPKFCLVAEDRDDAQTRGIEALNSYFKYLESKKA